EVHGMLNDWQAFCSSRGVGLADFARETPWRPPSLVLEADPPAHTRARAVLDRALSPSALRPLRAGLAEAAHQCVTVALERGECDVIPALAEAFPLSVFPDAMGITREGREHLLPYGSLAFNAFGPDNALRRDALAAAAPHVAWVAEQCRRENLAPDGIGAAIHAAADREEITRQEAELLVRSLLTAGLDTTVAAIGAALYCLATNPQAWGQLRADPTLARAAFEEALRVESPVQTFFRTTTRPVEVDGVTLGEGEKLLLFLGAANRDPRRWERPDEYDLTRRTAGHVGFGSGIHMCVGQLLSRLEGEALIAALARQVGTIEPAGEPVRRHNNTLRALAHLPLRLRAA
ncbi:MAG TPA: cytochrome P450, partial [Acetobacteraceae bacterium]|nr:cytochrome P450 [Acetobacteraceae bacterium]